MSLKPLVHPETISKSNLLYRGWRHLIQNRLWHGRMPERQNICLWFWPAVFATFVFTPILYPLLLVVVYPVKCVAIAICYAAYYPLKLVYVVLRFLLRRPIRGFASLCRIRLHRRLTVGHLLMLLVGMGLAWVPGVNYWWVGIATVFLVSYIAYWLGFSLLAPFFRNLWQLLGVLPGLWLTAEKYPGRQTQFWWWLLTVYLLLASPVVLWRLEGVSAIYTKIAIALGVILAIVGVVAFLRSWAKEHPLPGVTKPKREPWTKPVGIFVRAKKDELCPVVVFVD